MNEIRLTPSQILQGANAGILRQVQNIQKNRTPRFGVGSDKDWQLHVEGCLAELAVAQYFGIFWDANLGMLSKGDVGLLEVRSTSHPTGRLILHPSDKDESSYILVRGFNGSYKFAGWCFGHEAKQAHYWTEINNNKRPAYFYPNSELKPIESMFLTTTKIAA